MRRSTPRLAFGEPTTHPLEFYPGVNTTVRAGGKWMKAWIRAGEKPFAVVLLGPTGRKIGTGTVQHVEYGRLHEVRPEAYLCNYAGPMELEELVAEVIHQYAVAAKEDRRVVVGPTSCVATVYFTVDQE